MFQSNSEEEMDLDKDLSRIEKEQIIQKHIETISENMLKNEEKLPDFVRNSYCFKKKKESYNLEYVDQLFEQSSSQEIASAYSQLPDFVKNDPYIDKKLSHQKKKQLSKQ